MNKRYAITICVVLFAAGSFLLFTPSGLSRSEAIQIAGTELAKYCASERLRSDTFRLQEAIEDKTHRWAFDFASTSTPTHTVRIYVARSGSTEIHRMKDE